MRAVGNVSRAKGDDALVGPRAAGHGPIHPQLKSLRAFFISTSVVSTLDCYALPHTRPRVHFIFFTMAEDEFDGDVSIKLTDKFVETFTARLELANILTMFESREPSEVTMVLGHKIIGDQAESPITFFASWRIKEMEQLEVAFSSTNNYRHLKVMRLKSSVRDKYNCILLDYRTDSDYQYKYLKEPVWRRPPSESYGATAVIETVKIHKVGQQ